ncbi:hypothetical protein HU200_047290 [Digitaria exilis]|uniref:Uncharacterized protein n=1 Tax=Digitaria exilis TaxID=1010633 RepID=A0A835AX47_9POAL|nr:hypothetical protein HU200_047290 [Digitaria exilis]
MITTLLGTPLNAIKSLVQLVFWETWKERNARVFGHHSVPAETTVANIKDEVVAWMKA